MTLVAHYVADDFVNGLWQPRDGALGAYILSATQALTEFPRSRTRFRNTLYLPDATDVLANIAAKGLAPELGGGTTFEAIVYLTQGESNFQFTLASTTEGGDSVFYTINNFGMEVDLFAGGVEIGVDGSSSWPAAGGWHYFTFVIDLSVAGKQTLSIYDSASLVVSETFSNATVAANLATWSFLTSTGNMEIQAGAGGASDTGLLEWGIHDRVISAAEVTFRTTYFRVLNQ